MAFQKNLALINMISSKFNKVFNIIINKHSVYSIVLLFFQQVVVASSTLWIVLLVQDISSQNNFIVHLILFLLSLILPYFPGLLSIVELERWRQSSRYKYINSFVLANSQAVFVWNSPDYRDTRVAMLTQESNEVLSEFISQLHDFLGTAMNVLFNVIAIVFIVDYRFLFAYLISFLISLVFTNFVNRYISNAATKTQSSRLIITNILLNGWDNIVIGNVYNFSLWKQKFSSNFELLKKSAVSETFVRAGSSTLIALFSIFPIIIVLSYLFIAYRTQEVFLNSLVATLPRQILIISHIYIIIEYVNLWSAFSAKLNGLFTAIKAPNFIDLSSRICLDSILVEHNQHQMKINSLTNLNDFFNNFLPGRFTIRGKNGSGKSTLLLLLKNKHILNSILLPSQSHLEFNTSTLTLSSGQARFAILKEINSNCNVKILLLDEWDANLDYSAINTLSSILDELANNLCVIEVRHRT